MLIRIPAFRERSSNKTPPTSFWAGIQVRRGEEDSCLDGDRFHHPFELIRPKREGESETEDDYDDEEMEDADSDESQRSYKHLGGQALALV